MLLYHSPSHFYCSCQAWLNGKRVPISQPRTKIRNKKKKKNYWKDISSHVTFIARTYSEDVGFQILI